MPINIKELTLMSKNLKIHYLEDDKYAREPTLKLLKSFFILKNINVDEYQDFYFSKSLEII